MNILFTICARAGSIGVKGKNTRMFLGKPLVLYAITIYEQYLKQYKDSNDYIQLAVNTDSELLLEQIKKYEYIYIKRKKELAGGTVGKAEVIKDTLFEAEGQTGLRYDIVVDLDLTSPLRNASDVEGVIQLIRQNSICNYAYSVVKSRRNPYFNMVMKNNNGFFDRIIQSDYTARQQLPECYDMNASIYAYERSYLLNPKTERRFALIWEMEESFVLDIDNEEDFEIMEYILEFFWKKGKYLDLKGEL